MKATKEIRFIFGGNLESFLETFIQMIAPKVEHFSNKKYN